VSGRIVITLACLAASAIAVAARHPSAAHSAEPGALAATPSVPCTGARRQARYRHVVWFIFENHNTDHVAGHSPYMNRIAAKCGLLTNLTAVAHPSLPNYLALTSGSTHNVTDDRPPSNHAIATRNLFEQARSWRTYAEGMPRACSRSDGGSGYAVRHNPATYYTDLRRSCSRRDEPLSSLKPDLRRGRLARFTVIVPNLCHDEHDCSLSVGDGWLSNWLPVILGTTQYRAGRTLVLVTYDEGTQRAGHDPVYTVVIAPSVRPHTVVSGTYSHFSTLRTSERVLGLPLLGHARTARSYRRPFHL
jgi:hypothetical protein